MASVLARVRYALGLALVVAACGTPDAPAPSAASGNTLTVDGAPVAIARCGTGLNARRDGIALDLVLGEGAPAGATRLRFTRQQLHAAATRDGLDDGTPLDCAKLDRSWGGGARADGSYYWRGMLDFRCTHAGHAVVGRIETACGDPTPDEKASLDHQRDLHKQSQTGSGSASGSAR